MGYNKRAVFVLHSVFITWKCEFNHVFKLLTSICHNQISFFNIIVHIYDVCNPKHWFFFFSHACILIWCQNSIIDVSSYIENSWEK